MKTGPMVLVAMLTIGNAADSRAQTGTSLPEAFRGIATAAAPTQTNSAYTYAARPDFSQPSLSPQGTRLALIARLPDSITTLLVLDISGNTPMPITRLEVPNMKSVQSYGWGGEDKLVVWLNMDTKNSSDEDPSPSLYIAQLDLQTKKVTERTQPTKMEADITAPYPLSSVLVRAPWRETNHVLISECHRQGGVKFKQRGESAQYTFASTESLPSSTITCDLMDWNLTSNSAKRIARPFYAYPTRFFANATGDNLFAEGRKVGGKMVYGTMTPNTQKWAVLANTNPAELQPIWDANELDNAELWQKIHRILTDQLDPAGSVVKTSNQGTAVGIQFTSPETVFVPLDAGLQAANNMFNDTFAGLTAYAGSNIRWLGSTDDKGTVLFSVDSLNNPGTYFVWRQRDNTILRITDMRAINSMELAQSYLEPSWLPNYLLSAVTPAKNQIKGVVLMPMVMTDAAADTLLRSVDMTAEWFAANGLTTVRIPVGLPAALPEVQRGDAWRQQVASRINSVIKHLQQEFPTAAAEPICLYGKDANAYAALAAAVHTNTACVIAMNPKLDPKIFAQPYTMISTVAKTWYLSSDNAELRLWRSLYGSNQTTGTPASWQFPAGTNLMLGFEMFDEHRTLASYAGGLKDSINKSGGKYTLYTPNLDASKTDQWLSNQYDAMIKFILPPNLGKVGKIYIGDIQDTESKTPTSKK